MSGGVAFRKLYPFSDMASPGFKGSSLLRGLLFLPPVRMPAIPARRLERLLGRRTDALTNFFANVGIVLRHFQDRVVFFH
jgi:hypothetical protein